MDRAATLRAFSAVPQLSLGALPSPIEELARLRQALGGGPRLLVKRDDAIPFGFGGNKVRKLRLVAAEALRQGADTLVTCGGVQSNHCRATASAAARLGLSCVIVANGAPPARATGNALLDALLGAEVEYVASPQERAPAVKAVAERLRQAGRRPFEIPLGASTPLGALAYAMAIAEMLEQIPPPDAIVHASSSGGTQAGLVAGCALFGLATRVIGISADEEAPAIVATIRGVIEGMRELVGVDVGELVSATPIEVDDRFVGDGYGLPSAASQEAQQLAARCEALFVDHTYTAKALAGLVARARSGEFSRDSTLLFWHTGGQVGLFA